MERKGKVVVRVWFCVCLLSLCLSLTTAGFLEASLDSNPPAAPLDDSLGSNLPNAHRVPVPLHSSSIPSSPQAAASLDSNIFCPRSPREAVPLAPTSPAMDPPAAHFHAPIVPDTNTNPQSDPTTFIVKFIKQDGNEHSFRVTSNTKMGNVINKFGKVIGDDPSNFVYLIDGQRIKNTDLVTDDCEVNVMLHMSGGGF